MPPLTPTTPYPHYPLPQSTSCLATRFTKRRPREFVLFDLYELKRFTGALPEAADTQTPDGQT